jgi:hypothetical protein
MLLLFAVSIHGVMAENKGLAWESDATGDMTVVVAGHFTKDVKDEGVRPNESTSLSPNVNQTYFADARVRIPDVNNVSYFYFLASHPR